MSNPIKFALLGAAGFVAPRHMKAIKEVGGILVSAFDPHDSVGILDSYFPSCDFTSSWEQFVSDFDQKMKAEQSIDYLVVCTPNHLHDQHVIFGLEHGCDVICEKPLSLDAERIHKIMDTESKTKNRVNTILQLRLHSSLAQIKEIIKDNSSKLQVELEYFAPRGHWYHNSWKGDNEKSGGILMNIGVHFFDLLCHLFGHPQKEEMNYLNSTEAKGRLIFEHAEVDWNLNIRMDEASDGRRGLTINNQKFDFTDQFKKLHTKSYSEILLGNGFSSHACLPSVELVNRLRNK